MLELCTVRKGNWTKLTPSGLEKIWPGIKIRCGLPKRVWPGIRDLQGLIHEEREIKRGQTRRDTWRGIKAISGKEAWNIRNKGRPRIKSDGPGLKRLIFSVTRWGPNVGDTVSELHLQTANKRPEPRPQTFDLSYFFPLFFFFFSSSSSFLLFFLFIRFLIPPPRRCLRCSFFWPFLVPLPRRWYLR